MKTLRKIVIIAVVGMILWGCKKEEVISEKTQFLLGFWEIQKISSVVIINRDTILSNNLHLTNPSYACYKKVVFRFYKDGSLITDAGTGCNYFNLFISGEYKSNWSFQNEEKQLIGNLCYPSHCDILMLSADSLIFNSPSFDVKTTQGNGTSQITYYLKKTYTIQ